MPKTAKNPGSVLQAKIDSYNLTPAAVAKDIKVKNLNGVLSGKEEISADLALRLAKYFGGKPEEWIKIQLNTSKKELASEIKGISKAKKPAAEKKGKPGRKPGKKAAGRPAAADKKPAGRGRGRPAAAAKKPARAKTVKTVKPAKKAAPKPIISVPGPASHDF
jgi:addiction module HigA family antidote